jgi:transcriptional regulator with XRE-family HTH domain
MASLFEQQVRTVIAARGWSYKDLARESGVGASMIGRFMSGQRAIGSDALGKLIDALGCTLNAAPAKTAPRPKKMGRPRKPVLSESIQVPLDAGRPEVIISDPPYAQEQSDEPGRDVAEDPPMNRIPPPKVGRPRKGVQPYGTICPNQKRSGEIRTRRRRDVEAAAPAEAVVAAAAEGGPKN